MSISRKKQIIHFTKRKIEQRKWPLFLFHRNLNENKNAMSRKHPNFLETHIQPQPYNALLHKAKQNRGETTKKTKTTEFKTKSQTTRPHTTALSIIRTLSCMCAWLLCDALERDRHRVRTDVLRRFLCYPLIRSAAHISVRPTAWLHYY